MDIVLIGGLWLNSSVWDEVASGLTGLGHRPVPVALPGLGDGNTAATLDDQVGAVVAAVDAAQKPMVVGHSAACTLAWLAADRRPEQVGRVVLIGGFPSDDGTMYADFFPAVDGAMPFPGWEPFEGPDSADLDETARAGLLAAAIPVPVGVSQATVQYTDARRAGVPVTLLCPEFSPADAQEVLSSGDVPELSAAKDVSLVDLDTGHWPMISRPDLLVGALDEIARN